MTTANEAFFRVLIDAMLAAQGWHTTDPNEVRYEGSGQMKAIQTMNMRYLTASVVGVAAMVATFIAGSAYGWRRMDTFCGTVIHGAGAGHHVDLLAHHMKAIDALKQGNTAEADKELRFLAGLDALLIIECKDDAVCARVMGNPPPADAVLEAARPRREVVHNADEQTTQSGNVGH